MSHAALPYDTATRNAFDSCGGDSNSRNTAVVSGCKGQAFLVAVALFSAACLPSLLATINTALAHGGKHGQHADLFLCGCHRSQANHKHGVQQVKKRKRRVYAGHRPRALRKGPLTSKLARASPEQQQ
eukprot:1155078-Pelagomonas_calceolata.AAC.4